MAIVVDPFIPKTGLRTRIRASREPVPAGPERSGTMIRARHETRFRLRAPDGMWLHFTTHGWTARESEAWIGFKHQLIALTTRRDDLSGLFVVRVPPEKQGDQFLARVMR